MALLEEYQCPPPTCDCITTTSGSTRKIDHNGLVEESSTHRQVHKEQGNDCCWMTTAVPTNRPTRRATKIHGHDSISFLLFLLSCYSLAGVDGFTPRLFHPDVTLLSSASKQQVQIHQLSENNQHWIQKGFLLGMSLDDYVGGSDEARIEEENDYDDAAADDDGGQGEEEEQQMVCSSSKNNPSAEKHGNDFEEDDLGPSGVVLEDLAWRVAKLRLEEANTRRFLKAKPRFLPYDEARKWVQAWGRRWKTAEDWRNWIALGEKRNSYIPSRPDEYYGETGQWVSWEHFLGTVEE